MGEKSIHFMSFKYYHYHHHCHQCGTLETGTWQSGDCKRKKKKNRISPTLSEFLESPIPFLEPKHRTAPGDDRVHSLGTHFRVSACLVLDWDNQKSNSLTVPLLVGWSFRFCSSFPASLLVFTSLSPQIAAPSILSRFYISTQMVRQSGLGLFNFTWTWNSRMDALNYEDPWHIIYCCSCLCCKYMTYLCPTGSIPMIALGVIEEPRKEATLTLLPLHWQSYNICQWCLFE
jgi:hypothetical protein